MGCSTLLLAAVVSTAGGLVFGYELGIISGALLQLKAEFHLSCVQQEALVSALLVGALLASVVGGCLIDRQGRRKSIVLSNLLILAGSLVLLVSSYYALVVGRILVGFAMCISSMSCCIFVSEMVAPDRRGFLVTLHETGITVGVLAAYIINYFLSACGGGWRWMFGLAVVPTLLQLVSVRFLPSSAEEPDGDRETDDSRVEAESVRFNAMFQSKDNMRTRTAIGLGLVLFQQLTGQPNVLFYASTIFHSVGFQSDAAAALASVGLGSVKVIVTLTSMASSDRVGRRPLLIGGCSLMALSLIAIGVLSGHPAADAKRPCDSEDFGVNGTARPHSSPGNGSHMFPTNDTPGGDGRHLQPLDTPLAPSPSDRGAVANWAILVCMMAVVGAYSVGFGPMTWLLLSEIFPAAIRGRAFAFTNCFNWAAHLLVTFTFLNFIDSIGVSGTFLLYGSASLAAAGFFYFLLPETKGKTLEEIDRELRSKRFFHSDKPCCCFLGCRDSSHQYQRIQYQVGTEDRLH
ncbi:solute carrier family 2, facilitated glucose transporter member 10 [Brachionichthys hirsutus]|uniref:solute carrier family 2, facilitated glucose transporter member 10 n=1 Tax=Brachionichthys hirsutus TaxID=412623 RepID=UPI003604E043